MKFADKEVGGVQLPEDAPSWLIQLAGAVQSIPREEFSRQIKSFTSSLEQRWHDSAVNEARRLVEAYDLQPKDVFSRSVGVKKAQGSRNVKYMDPNTGNSWSGRGRRPDWLSGKDLTEFQVKA